MNTRSYVWIYMCVCRCVHIYIYIYMCVCVPGHGHGTPLATVAWLWFKVGESKTSDPQTKPDRSALFGAFVPSTRDFGLIRGMFQRSGSLWAQGWAPGWLRVDEWLS